MVKHSDITIMKSSPSGIICPREKASRDRESWNQVLKNLLLRNQLLWNETLQPLILTTIKDGGAKLEHDAKQMGVTPYQCAIHQWRKKCWNRRVMTKDRDSTTVSGPAATHFYRTGIRNGYELWKWLWITIKWRRRNDLIRKNHPLTN